MESQSSKGDYPYHKFLCFINQLGNILRAGYKISSLSVWTCYSYPKIIFYLSPQINQLKKTKQNKNQQQLVKSKKIIVAIFYIVTTFT